MKFAPRRSQIIGRMAIKRSASVLVLVDETKVTKFVLVDAVGDEAAAAGVKVGDVVVPTAVGNIVMNDGFRPVLEEKNVAFFVTDVAPGELLVQTDTGNKYVPIDSPDAARPLGAAPIKTEEAA